MDAKVVMEVLECNDAMIGISQAVGQIRDQLIFLILSLPKQAIYQGMSDEDMRIIVPKRKKEKEDQPVKKSKNNREERREKNKFKVNRDDSEVNDDTTTRASTTRGFTQSNPLLQQFQDMFPFHSASTLSRILSDCKNNYDEASKIIFTTPPEHEEQPLIFQEESIIEPIGDRMERRKLANNLLDQVCGPNDFQMSGEQFQELFADIAEAMKADQVIGMGQINNFMNDFIHIKKMMADELVSHQINIRFDDPLLIDMQHFSQQIIEKNQVDKKKLFEDFPLPTVSQGKNKIEQIKEICKQNEKQSYDEKGYFVERKRLPKENLLKHTIYKVDETEVSARDIKALHQEFPFMYLSHLKYIYIELQDYKLCRDFLHKYHNDKKAEKKEEKKNIVQKQKPMHTNMMKKQEVDERLKGYSYDELREEIDRLFKLKQVYQLTRAKISNAQSKAYLQRKTMENQPLLKKLAQASRVMLVQMQAQKDPLKVDLHTYRAEEVESVLDSMVEMIRSQFQRGNKAIKRIQNYCVLSIVTGDGNHSRGRVSVLKPLIQQWARNKDFRCGIAPGEGEVWVQVKIA